MAASLVAYAWVMGYLGFTTAKVGNAIQIQSIARAEDNTLTVYVQNVGDSDVVLSDVYADAVLNDPAVEIDGTPATLGVTVLPQAETAEIVLSGDYSGAAQVTVKVVAADGTFTELTKTFTGP